MLSLNFSSSRECNWLRKYNNSLSFSSNLRLSSLRALKAENKSEDLDCS